MKKNAKKKPAGKTGKAGPLAGRVILDCSILLPGPLVGKLLRLQGARVIKIEHPAKPDPARAMGAFYDDLNHGKHVRKLDLADPADRGRFHELVRKADGLIEAFRPEAKARLGLDEKTLLDVNPRLCIASLVGYPERGPWRDRAGHDLNFQAVTGTLSLFREQPGLPLADLFGAYSAAFGISAALDSMARGGRGRRVVISLAEALRDCQSMIAREFQASGKPPLPGTTLFSGLYPCYRIYRCSDGKRVAVGAIESKFWARVCEILGVPELATAGMAVDEEGLAAAARVQAAFGSKPWAHWAPLFEKADCCVEPVLSYAEAYPKT